MTLAVFSDDFPFMKPFLSVCLSFSGVCMAGRVRTVISASLTRAVYTEPALNPGSASVTLTGVDNSVTKVSTRQFDFFSLLFCFCFLTFNTNPVLTSQI